MTVRLLAFLVAVTAFGAVAIPRVQSQQTSVRADAEHRAVAFLAREVPLWRREHPCYSCHNNGDAARALIAAAERGHRTQDALRDTLDWLSRPERWDTNAQGGGFEDLTLARIQFAAAATDATLAGMAPATALAGAAAIVVRDQDDDGAWRLDVSQSIGSPATYGTALATWSARRTLVAAARPEDSRHVARADEWLRKTPAATVLDAAAVTLGLGTSADGAANSQRAKCLAIIRSGQAPDGGWGPYVTAPSEPFDTAVVMLALASLDPSLAKEWREALQRGREYLLKQQLSDGSWPETTRPARQESYAQRISTAAWATLALLGARITELPIGPTPGRVGLVGTRQRSVRSRRGSNVLVSPAAAVGDVKRNEDLLGLGRPIRALEVVHFERPSDPVAGKVFEHR
jgi:hypothetical protein